MLSGIFKSKLLLVAAILFLAGCSGPERRAENGDCIIPCFVPVAVHIKPSFSRIVPGEKDPSSSEIEVYVSLDDQFGDPAKAAGNYRFELFHYRPATADSRGERIAVEGIQQFDLSDVQLSQQHWDSTTRSYRFKLKLQELPTGSKQVVLQVMFFDLTGRHFQDVLVLQRNSR
jgi:hypothetical protein